MAQLGCQFSMNPEDVPQQPKVSQDSQRDPKEQNRQWEPKGTPRRAKGSPKEGKGSPKSGQRWPKAPEDNPRDQLHKQTPNQLPKWLLCLIRSMGAGEWMGQVSD